MTRASSTRSARRMDSRRSARIGEGNRHLAPWTPTGCPARSYSRVRTRAWARPDVAAGPPGRDDGAPPPLGVHSVSKPTAIGRNYWTAGGWVGTGKPLKYREFLRSGLRQRLLAMQKVVGSNPIGRFKKRLQIAGVSSRAVEQCVRSGGHRTDTSSGDVGPLREIAHLQALLRGQHSRLSASDADGRWCESHQRLRFPNEPSWRGARAERSGSGGVSSRGRPVARADPLAELGVEPPRSLERAGHLEEAVDRPGVAAQRRVDTRGT
jgi:hypothetical protein